MKKFLQNLGIMIALVLSYQMANAQYCSPTCTTSAGDWINNFSTTGAVQNVANLNSGQSGGYQYYTTGQIVAQLGSTFSFSVQSGSPTWSEAEAIYVDWNNDGDFLDAGEAVWNSGSAANSATVWTSSITVPTTATADTLRLRVCLQYASVPTNACGNWYDGEVEDYNLIILPPYANDAGIAAITQPVNHACAYGNSDVKVLLTNSGQDTLTSATINWSVNGVSQTAFSWTGSIAPQGLDTVNIGNYTFSNGDTLKVYSSQPNGGPDSLASNDTSLVVLHQSMGGVYTLGGPGADFPSFDSAVYALQQSGVCGPVIFNVYDTTYNEQVVLGSIIGASATNTITFVGDSLNHPLLTSSANNYSANYTLQFNGASYFRFKNLDITNTGTYYNIVLDFEPQSTNNIITNCLIQNDTMPTSSSSSKSLVYSYCYSASAQDQDTNNVFTNNTFRGGSYGLYWYGGYSNHSSRVTIDNNEFRDQYYAPIYLYYVNNITVKHNTIHSNSNYYGGYGLRTYYSYGNNEISYNKIYSDSGATWPSYGMYLYYFGNTQTDTSIVYNNFIAIGDSLSTMNRYGIYQNYSNFDKVYNNNINVYTQNTSSIAFENYYSDFAQIFNNIMRIDSGTVYYTNGSVNVTADYNDLYTQGSNLIYDNGVNYATLSNYQTNLFKQLNSISVDPMYHSNIDLHVCNDSLNNAGMSFNGLMMDIDGEARNTNSPVIGADVFFNPASAGFLGPDITLCPGDTVTLGTPNQSGTFLWSSGDTTSSIMVGAAGNYFLTAQNACGSGTDNVVVTDGTPNAAWIIAQQSYTTVVFDGPSGYNSYHWDFGDGDTSNIEDPYHIYAAAGGYVVTLTVTNQCGTDTAMDTIKVTTLGIAELNSSSLTISPNPSNGRFTLNLNGLGGKTANVSIISMEGKVVYQSEFSVSSNAENKVINLKEAAGVYTMKLMVDNKMSIKRLIVK